MLTWRPALLTMVVALCLTPTAFAPLAVAQSAGDDQYSDPFENSGGGTTKGGTTKGGSSTGSETQSGSGSNGSTQSSPAVATPTRPAVTELPRTGRNLWPLVATGLVLVTAGFVLVRWSGTAR